MSKMVWDRLDGEDQAIIKQAAIESTIVERQAWLEMEQEAEENAIAQGATVTYLTPEKSKVLPGFLTGRRQC